ncbi:MAG: HDOD domain-containing protein [Chitinivibrionales bacterium]|nr:HDOD domain-containing protein [Chitinivibrionales bacterium]
MSRTNDQTHTKRCRQATLMKREKPEPLVVLYSNRARIIDVLTVGLVQANYQVLQADSSYVAVVKSYQFQPDLVIIDITEDNTKDVLIIQRLRKTQRTSDIAILTVLPNKIKTTVDKLMADPKVGLSADKMRSLHTIEYPFNFSDLLVKVKSIVPATESPQKRIPKSDKDKAATLQRIANRLYDLHIPIEVKLSDIEATMSKQWAFPFTVIKALDIIESDDSGFAELGKCVATDPGASAAILKVANTVHYARRGGKAISDLSDAVMRLGFNETRNLLACLALIDLSSNIEQRYGFSRQQFWLHSLATGLIAQKLCVDCGYRRPELAFVAGLVHDLGKIPLDNNFHPVFLHLLDETASRVTSFQESEDNLLSFSHGELGHYLTKKWNFPQVISNAILKHHDAEQILETSTPIERIVEESVFAANIMAKSMTFGHSCDEFLDEIPEALLHELKIGRGPKPDFFVEIASHLKLLCHFLNLPTQKICLTKERKDKQQCEVTVIFTGNIEFHPIVLALKNAGFIVHTGRRFDKEKHGNSRIILTIAERGNIFNIMLYEDERQTSLPKSILKIYLMDKLPSKDLVRSFCSNDLLFINRKHFDFRMLLQSLDSFLGEIIVPEKEEVELPDPGRPTKSKKKGAIIWRA